MALELRYRGEQIPDGARLLALADPWDAMTSERPYRPAVTAGRAFDICRGEAGRQLDASVVEALARLWEAGEIPESADDDRETEAGAGPALSYRGAGTTAVRAPSRRPVAGSGLVYRGSTVEGPPR